MVSSWLRPHRSHSPSSPPGTEKSRSRMIHFWMRWALEGAFSFTWLIPSWMAVWTRRSRPPATSDTSVALLPRVPQNSTASGDISSSGSPVSAFTWHCRDKMVKGLNEKSNYFSVLCNFKCWNYTFCFWMKAEFTCNHSQSPPDGSVLTSTDNSSMLPPPPPCKSPSAMSTVVKFTSR